MPHATVALAAKYLKVCQYKLGTIIIQTVHILQHESAVTDCLPEREFVHGHSNLLPNDLARQKYRYTYVLIEAACYQYRDGVFFVFWYFRRRFYQHLNSKIIHDGSLNDFCTK
jgi:hypothetical protein